MNESITSIRSRDRQTTVKSFPVKRVSKYMVRLIFSLWIGIVIVACENSENSTPTEYSSILMEVSNTPIEIERSHLSDCLVSNSAAIHSLADVFLSENLEKIEEALGEMHAYALHVEKHLLMKQNPPPIRNFQLLPGLRDVLIHMWESEYSQTSTSTYKFERDAPGWKRIPKILSVMFPGDQKVHDLIWTRHDPDQPIATIQLLDNGGFLTPEANSLRIETLRDLGPYKTLFAYHAAMSLGRFQSDEGFEALLETLASSTDTVLTSFVAEAIVAHGFVAVEYKHKITEITEKLGVDESTQIVELSNEFVQSYGYVIYMFSKEAAKDRLVRMLQELKQLEQYRTRFATQTKD